MSGKLPFLLPSPEGGSCDLMIIAGEHSGDQHAAHMLVELKQQQPDLRVVALGGDALQSAGAQLLFDLTAHSVVGFAEVAKNYSFFKSLLDECARWIAEHRPKHVCFIDYPGFNLRLAEKLKQMGLSRKGGGEIGMWYYIGPQIWAWKQHRRHKMAAILDGLSVIFPFEVDCYADTPLPVDFVGHPFVRPDYELAIKYAPDGPALLLPGSRAQPVQRIYPTQLAAYALARLNVPELKALSVYPSDTIKRILMKTIFEYVHLAAHVDFQPASRGLTGCAALTSSGTMSLAIALAGIPAAITYKAHPFTYHFAKAVIKIPYLGMPNILLNEPLLPEYIQKAADPEVLAEELTELTTNKDRIDQAQEGAKRLRETLSPGNELTPGAWLAANMAG